MSSDQQRLEVWGSPIAHSKSPLLHRAAYQVLGVPWTYDRREVTEEHFGAEFSGLEGPWRGLSLTMPLKEVALECIGDHRGLVDTLGAANTAVRGEKGWWLEATDPFGAGALLRDLEAEREERVWVLGGGATARSILAALPFFAPASVTLVVRNIERAQRTRDVADRVGLPIRVVAVSNLAEADAPTLVVSTIPGSDLPPFELSDEVIDGSRYADVAYHPWPTALARRWLDRGRPVESGLTMLIFQAVAQVRAFVQGDISRALDRERDIVRAMASAVGEDPDRMVSLAVEE